MERLANISTVVFDKTGTITKGKLALQNIEVFHGNEDDAIRIATAVESCTIHPLASALQSVATNRGMSFTVQLRSLYLKGLIGLR